MQYRNKILTAFLAVAFACGLPFQQSAACAESFNAHKPSFGLYCPNGEVIQGGAVKYMIGENGNAVQQSEYRINVNDDDSVLYIPFLSAPCELPPLTVSLNGKAVTKQVCYGETVYDYESYHIRPDSFYSAGIDENLTGTLYTITAESECFTVDFEKAADRSVIYSFPDRIFVQHENGKYSYTVSNACTGSDYEVYVLSGDFTKFESTAKFEKEPLTVKDYIDRRFLKNLEYYSLCGNIPVGFFYALTEQVLQNKTVCSDVDFFFNSISQKRINAYQISVESGMPCTVSYSMPVEVQQSSSFKPPIYMVKQTSAGNYSVEVSIELNGNLPYMLESDMQLTKQSDTVFAAKDVSGDFYFIYGSVQTPRSSDTDTDARNFTIILSVALSAVCILIILTVYFILKGRKKNL